MQYLVICCISLWRTDGKSAKNAKGDHHPALSNFQTLESLKNQIKENQS